MSSRSASLLWINLACLTIVCCAGTILLAQHSGVTHEELDRKLDAIVDGQRDQDKMIVTNTQRITDIDDRLRIVERAEMGERVTKLETIVGENQIYLRAVIGALILLLVEMLVRRAISARRDHRKDGSGDD